MNSIVSKSKPIVIEQGTILWKSRKMRVRIGHTPRIHPGSSKGLRNLPLAAGSAFLGRATDTYQELYLSVFTLPFKRWGFYRRHPKRLFFELQLARGIDRDPFDKFYYPSGCPSPLSC